MARVMACRTHHVAYVENLYPRRYSNLSTAFIRPILPSWIRSRNCRPRLVYFLAMEMTRRRFASTISFLACRASRSPFCTICTILRNSPISSPVSPASTWISWRCCLTFSLSRATRLFQPLAESFDTRLIELGALVVLEKILARDAVAFGEPHQAAFVADQTLVDVVELLDQRVDARLIEPQRLHLADDVVLELLVFALLRGRQRAALEPERDVLVLQAAQPLVLAGDVVEGLDHLGLELGLNGGKRERVLHIVVIEIAFAGRGLAALAVLAVGALGRALERRRAGGRRRRRRGLRQHRGTGNRRRAGRRHDRLAVGADHRRRHRFGVGPGIGRFEVDDVAQEHLSLVELVAPNDDGLEGERALAQPGDHRFAAGLDALGDGDLALARE